MTSFSTRILLMHMDGTNNSTVFTDEMGHIVTPYGNAKISTADSKFGGASAYFGGDGGCLEISNERNFGAGDLTIELWMKTTGINVLSNRVFMTKNIDRIPGIYLSFNTASQLAFNFSNIGNWGSDMLIFNIPENIWMHIAITLFNNIFSVWLDGVLMGTRTSSGVLLYDPSDIWIIGGQQSPNRSMIGFIDEFVILNYAKYISSFTPPAVPYGDDVYGHKATGLILPSHNQDLNGLGLLTGTTKVQDNTGFISTTPNRLVRLYDQKTGKLVAQTRSDAAGAWAFTDLNPNRQFYVADFDDSYTFNAVIADNYYPGLIP